MSSGAIGSPDSTAAMAAWVAVPISAVSPTAVSNSGLTNERRPRSLQRIAVSSQLWRNQMLPSSSTCMGAPCFEDGVEPSLAVALALVLAEAVLAVPLHLAQRVRGPLAVVPVELVLVLELPADVAAELALAR